MEEGQAYWEQRAAQGQDKDGFEWFSIDYQRLEPLLEDIGALSPTKKTLEVGCGTSHLLLKVALARQAKGGKGENVKDNNGSNLSGVDYSPTCIARQRQMMEQAGLTTKCSNQAPELQVMDASAMTFSDAHFDVLLDKGALDSVDMTDCDVAKCAQEYARILKRGGQLLLVSCRMPLQRRLECLEKLPFQLKYGYLIKAPGQEHAPGGFGAFVLERIMEDNYQFCLKDICLDNYIVADTVSSNTTKQQPWKDQDNNSHKYYDATNLYANEADDLFGAMRAEMEAY